MVEREVKVGVLGGGTILVSFSVLFYAQCSNKWARVPSSVAQRTIIKILTNEGVKHSEILTCLKAQLGDALSQNRAFTWARQFKGGWESVENESRPNYRRPRSSLTDDNISAVREHNEGDRRLTVDKMHWETLEHPPYSPYLCSCDSFICAHESIAWRGTIRKQWWTPGVCAQLVNDTPSKFFWTRNV